MASSNSFLNVILKMLTRSSRNASVKYRLLLALMVVGIIVAAGLYPPLNQDNDTENTPPSTQTLPAGMYKVSRIADGDTFSVLHDAEEYTIRLIGVDTPEVVDPRRPVQCFGKEASAELKQLLTNQSVRLESDPTQSNTDQYGRWLRYAYLPNGSNLNLLLIQQGYAYEYTYRGLPYQQQLEFKAAQQIARTQEAGLWNPAICPP